MKQWHILTIAEKISEKNPLHAKKIKNTLKGYSEKDLQRIEYFLKKYIKYLTKINKDLEYGINCYLQMIAELTYEQIRFMETGKYSCSSFEEARQKVYNNPQIMDSYMNALILSQFLWQHHYRIFSYFIDSIPQYKEKIKRYLEIGAGHGLFTAEAARILEDNTYFEVVDISPTSIKMAAEFIDNSKIHYTLKDIFNFDTKTKFDFISMGELLEHVENPVKLLSKLKTLLNDDGLCFITVPANAPAIDHIFLFKNEDDIISTIRDAGMKVIDKICAYAETPQSGEDIPEQKIAMMFAAFIEKK